MRCFATARAPLAHRDLASLRAFRSGLRHGDLQRSILERGFDALFLRVIRQGETAQEAAVHALYAMELLVLLALLLAALTFDREHTVFARDLDLFLLHFRQVDLDQVRLVGL